MRFVTDFLWRSPLGLRINAQDTAGVTQTEDWVRFAAISWRRATAHYDVRITAELWETHFFDHVSLMVVDHPDGHRGVRRRAVRRQPRRPAGRADGAPPRPVDARRATIGPRRHRRSWPRATAATSRPSRAARTRGSRSRHAVEVDLPAEMRRRTARCGWWRAAGSIRPTAASTSRSGRAARAQPQRAGARSAGRRPGDGPWCGRISDSRRARTRRMLIDLGRSPARRWRSARLRLRTNLEIYWDRLAVAGRPSDAPDRSRRGCSLRAPSCAIAASRRRRRRVGESPETPRLRRASPNTAPRWRDLVGYYTRFGDVRELLARRRRSLRDHERRRRAAAARSRRAGAAAPGWRRDFVLIGDGWEKDGDYNTGVLADRAAAAVTRAAGLRDGRAGGE